MNIEKEAALPFAAMAAKALPAIKKFGLGAGRRLANVGGKTTAKKMGTGAVVGGAVGAGKYDKNMDDGRFSTSRFGHMLRGVGTGAGIGLGAGLATRRFRMPKSASDIIDEMFLEKTSSIESLAKAFKPKMPKPPKIARLSQKVKRNINPNTQSPTISVGPKIKSASETIDDIFMEKVSSIGDITRKIKSSKAFEQAMKHQDATAIAGSIVGAIIGRKLASDPEDIEDEEDRDIARRFLPGYTRNFVTDRMNERLDNLSYKTKGAIMGALAGAGAVRAAQVGIAKRNPGKYSNI